MVFNILHQFLNKHGDYNDTNQWKCSQLLPCKIVKLIVVDTGGEERRKEKLDPQFQHLTKCKLDYLIQSLKYIIKSPTVNTKGIKTAI